MDASATPYNPAGGDAPRHRNGTNGRPRGNSSSGSSWSRNNNNNNSSSGNSATAAVVRDTTNWRRSRASASPAQPHAMQPPAALNNRNNNHNFNNKNSNNARPSALPEVGAIFNGQVARCDLRFGSFVQFSVPPNSPTSDSNSGSSLAQAFKDPRMQLPVSQTGLMRDVHLPVGRELQVVVAAAHQHDGKIKIDLLWAPPPNPPPPLPSHPQQKQHAHLLILDLNGVLLDRKKFEHRQARQHSRGGRHPPNYVKRPHCDEFIRFCMEHFYVGVWSCGKRTTMELELFKSYEEQIVFVFDQDHSVNLWPQRSVVSPGKPLFLKDLRAVWSKFPQFGPHNTILIDNHLEKFERNPLHTSLLVPETPDNVEGLLAFDGHVVSQLRALARAPNVQEYIHLHPDSLFPTAHPIAPPATPEQQGIAQPTTTTTMKGTTSPRAHSNGVNGSTILNSTQSVDSVGSSTLSIADSKSLTSADSLALRTSLASLFVSSAVMKKHCPERDVGFYLHHRDTPGPRAAPFARRHLQECAHDGLNKWLVCEKTDGVRNLLFAPVVGVGGKSKKSNGGSDVRAGVYLVNRAWEFTRVASKTHPLYVGMTNSGKGAGLVDGELMNPKHAQPFSSTNGSQSPPAFLVFDAVWLGGEDIGAIAQLKTRLERMSAMLRNAGCLSGKVDGLGSQCGISRVLVKKFIGMNEVERLRTSVESGNFHYTDVGAVECDGLVLTPAAEMYYSYSVLKYKPQAHLTVDFKVKGHQLKTQPRRRGSKTEVGAVVDLYLNVFAEGFDGRRVAGEQVVGKLILSSDQLVKCSDAVCDDVKRHGGGSTRGKGSGGRANNKDQQKQLVIVECTFASRKGCWEMIRVREDKVKPNSMDSAWRVMEAIAENVQMSDFVTEWGTLRITNSSAAASLAPGTSSGSGGSVSISGPIDSVDGTGVAHVAAHYNERQSARNERKDLDGDIYMLRKLNNWVKAVVVNVFCADKPITLGLALDGNHRDGELLMSEVTAECPEVLLHPTHKKNNDKRNKGHQQNSRTSTKNVLDICCGRGGDMNKYISSLAVNVLVGVDIAEVALEEARSRAKQPRRNNKNKPKRIEYVLGDAADPMLPEFVRKSVESPELTFDVAAIQFSFHYLCDTRERCVQFFKSMNVLVKAGGKLMMTTTDSRVIRERTSHGDSSSESNGSIGAFKNEVCAIVLQDGGAHSNRVVGSDFGQAYAFSLGDAVCECVEFVVPLEEVIEIAREAEFELRFCHNLSRVAAAALEVPELRSLATDMKLMGQHARAMSTDEWEAVQLYIVVVFERLQ